MFESSGNEGNQALRELNEPKSSNKDQNSSRGMRSCRKTNKITNQNIISAIQNPHVYITQANYTQNHRKSNKNTPNQSYSICIQCLNQMKQRSLFQLWQSDGNIRKRRLNVILFILIIENESLKKLNKFISLYRQMVNEIINGVTSLSPRRFSNFKKKPHFEDINLFLEETVTAIQCYIEGKNLTGAIKILYSQNQPTQIDNAIDYLKQQREMINRDFHKRLKKKRF